MYKSIVLFAVLSLVVSSTVHYAIDADFKITPLTADMMDYYQDLATTVATIKFVNEINTTGWTYQYITTNQNYPDAVQTAAAGYLEGYATWNLIWALYINYNFSITAEVAEWVETQNAWIKNQTVTYPDDDFWDLVNTTIAWEEGMYAGYVAAVIANGNLTFELTYQQFYLLSYSSDLGDVQGIFGQQQPIGATSHCSFLLRLTESGLFGSQTTFTNYNQMIRVYKYYKFNLRSYLVHNQEVAFSSYPGTVPSIDDFYVLSNNKYVAETTLVNYNQQAYAWLHTDSVPYWIRIMMANWAFDTMDHWVETYFSNRSGTYNNQWMIVDYDVYNENKNSTFSNVTNLIWMVEEFYELTSVADLTQTMIAANGFAAGYNVAYNQTLAAFSQAPTNYTDDPRAILFGKYAPGVQTFEEFQYVMRLNNFSDTGDYCQAIASRCDLNPSTVFPWGSIDCKTTNDQLMWDLQTYIQAGPTHELEAPFTWSAWPQYESVALGMPEVFNFTWVFSDPHSNMTENGEIMISA